MIATSPDWLGWLIGAPLAGSVVAFLWSGRRRPVALALGTVGLVATGAVVQAVYTVLHHGPTRLEVGGWGAPVGIELALDGLSAAFLTVTLIVVVAASVHAQALLGPSDPDGSGAPRARHTPGPQARTFWPLWLLLWAGLNALFLSGDLFNVYVTLELIGMSGVALVATSGGLPSLRAALRYFFTNVTASMVFLGGVVLVYHRYQTLDLALLRATVGPDAVTGTALAFITAGLALKAALFPLHAWLPTAHSAAPAPVSAALSALVVKAPIYVLLRIWLDAFHPAIPDILPVLIGTLGAVGMVWGSSQAFRAERLKTLVAYSTVAQIGLLFAAFPIVWADRSSTAWRGFVFIALAHALAKSAMFLSAGAIAHAHGHDRLREMSGFGMRHPLSTYAFGLAGMSLVGVPGTAGFMGKWLLATSGAAAGQAPWVVVVAVSTLFTASYIWRVLAVAIRTAPAPPTARALPARVEWVALALAAFTLILGIAPGALFTLIGVGMPGAFAGLSVEPVNALPLFVLSLSVDLLPPFILASSLIPGLVIFFLPESRHRLRTTLNLSSAVVKLAAVAVLVSVVASGQSPEWRWPLLPGSELVLQADELSVFFVALSAGLWLATTIYAIAYLEGSPQRSRFFGFFSLCVSATVGVALAGNLLTFLFFYEILTITTYPLVVHRGTRRALAAGGRYLAYTLSGGVALFLGTAWLTSLTGSVDFIAGAGALDELARTSPLTLQSIFVLLIAGLAVKAAIVPLHGWLPVAMIAPAPVSALLHAVAVVKAGAFGILRVVYDVYGVRAATGLNVLPWLAGFATFTILYGSLRALVQDDLKRRLAYSTVSQLSYIALGAALATPLALVGAVVHLVHQGLMKVTLFFCAGNLAETLHVHRVSEMRGIGRRMPWTMGAFTVAALGMIGVPPVAGFVSKWYLGMGAVRGGQQWVVAVLVVSGLLNAAYFLPILKTAWLDVPTNAWPHRPRGSSLETSWMLLLPALVTAALSLLVGLLAGMGFSPLGWAERIAQSVFTP